MTEKPWIASGPDAFGDFHISSEGEQLAKCVVVQNGFRTPQETAEIAQRLIKAVNSHEALVDALKAAREYVEVEAADSFRPAQRLLEQIDSALTLTKSRNDDPLL